MIAVTGQTSNAGSQRFISFPFSFTVSKPKRYEFSRSTSSHAGTTRLFTANRSAEIFSNRGSYQSFAKHAPYFLRARIKSFSELPENWNYYGAVGIPAEVVDYAVTVLDHLTSMRFLPD